MSLVVVKNSVISGVHRTKVGPHEAMTLIVEADNSISHIDLECMKVVFPKNPDHKQFKDQLVEDVLGKVVGNVTPNLCHLFHRLLERNLVRNMKWYVILQPTFEKENLQPG